MRKKTKSDKIDGYNVHQILQDAWLNVIINEKTLYNPMEVIPDVCSHRPELYYSWLLTRPEYLGLAAKVLLNINLAPFQVVILQQMWTHKFPMLVGSRGCGKTFILAVYALLRALLIPNRKVVIVGSVFRQSKLVFNYIKTIYDNSPVLRSITKDEPHFSNDRCHLTLGTSKVTALPIGSGDKIRGERSSEILADEFACLSRNSLLQTDLGIVKIEDYLDGEAYSLLNKDNEFEYPDTIFRTPKVDVYRITTQYGFTIDCSEIHQVMTYKGWRKTLELKTSDYIKLGFNDYFPKEEYKDKNGNILDKDLAWLIGILVSEGTVTNRNFISIKNTDRSLIDLIKNKYNFEWNESFKPAHTNDRGWNCKDSWDIQYSNTKYRTMLRDMGVDYVKSIEKQVPHSILRSTKECVLSFLSGLYEGDGTAFYCQAKRSTGTVKEFQVVYYTSSKELLKQVQLLLLKFGILSGTNDRGVMKNSKNESFRLVTRGSNAVKLFNLLNVQKWKDIKNPDEITATRDRSPIINKSNNGKRFVVSTNQCDKNKYLGTFDTEEECIAAFNIFWENNTEYLKIKSIEKLPEKEVLYDFHMPKTHSFIANGFVQHNSQSKEIFETVIAGFGAVSADPMSQVKLKASQVFANYLGIELEDDTDEYDGIGNQIILSGTAYYHFNHFAQYWEKWKQIIHSRGEKKKLQTIFGDQEIDDSFNWKDYCVVRLPANLLPPGFMDASQLARSKATLPSDTYQLEFDAIFSKDSNGFFKASLLEKCTANEENDITHPSGRVVFEARVKGEKGREYVIGVDPASEQDRFAVVVIELHQDHRRIVHVWTTNSEEFKAKRKAGIIEENDFYGYTARKIRDLMILFPCVHLAIDSQGGGKAVYEALHDTTKLKEGEHPLWEVIEEDKNKDSDGEEGLHIVEMVNFASAEYTSFANHSMKKDFEDKILLFPRFNPAISAVAAAMNKINMRQDSGESINGVRLYDSYEDAIEEIEELKKELSQIVITRTAMGRERWDTPDIKISGTEKGKMRKDRYSALVMANAAARKMSGPNYIPKYDVMGLMNKQEAGHGKDFIGPAWITNQLNDLYS